MAIITCIDKLRPRVRKCLEAGAWGWSAWRLDFFKYTKWKRSVIFNSDSRMIFHEFYRHESVNLATKGRVYENVQWGDRESLGQKVSKKVDLIII